MMSVKDSSFGTTHSPTTPDLKDEFEEDFSEQRQSKPLFRLASYTYCPSNPVCVACGPEDSDA